MRASVTLWAMLSTLLAAAAAAAPVICTRGELSRSVEVVYSDPGRAIPCEVLYDKPTEGSQTTPWRASSEAGYCEAKARELVETLESLGWDCAVERSDAGPSELRPDRAAP